MYVISGDFLKLAQALEIKAVTRGRFTLHFMEHQPLKSQVQFVS